VLVWTKAPFLFRNEVVATDELVEQRQAGPEEVKRLGDRPIVLLLRVDGKAAEVAAHTEDAELFLGPYVPTPSHDTRDRTDSDRPGESKHSVTEGSHDD
jgi:hypothetical protein